MTYQFLSSDLFPVADSAKSFLTNQWGIASSKIQVETPFAPDIARPTLHAIDSDFYTICIEVSDRLYPPQADAMILDCMTLHLPVKLYIAVPAQNTLNHAELQRAKDKGVGVLMVKDTGECVLFERALSLSFVAVRKPHADFPKKYRLPVTDAHMTFIQGDPAKGCAKVYDEIENLTRRIAVKAAAKGWWKSAAPPPPDASNESVGIKGIAHHLTSYFNWKLAKTPKLNSYLLAQVEGVVGPRNQVAHKPKTAKALKNRDTQLRTQFEHAVDTLHALIQAAAPLRV